MFKRKDVIRSLFLILLIVTIMITLSQILVVHHHNHLDPKQRDLTKLRNMLRELERNIALMLKRDVLPPEKYMNSFQALIFSKRIASIVDKGKSEISVSDTEDTGVYKIYSSKNDRKSRLLQNLASRNHSSKLARQSKRNAQNKHVARMSEHGKRDTFNYMSSRVAHNTRVVSNINPAEDDELYGQQQDIEVRQQEVVNNNMGKNANPKQMEAKKKSCHKCPKIPTDLEEPLKVDLNISEKETARAHYGDLQPGGIWQPRVCVSRHHVAIVIPYRDRWSHLRVLLHFLIPVLQRQQINFRIFVVEQHGNGTFNKGRLMNAAFKEAWKMADFECFIFHDVDLIPEDHRNMYTCPTQPRHMSPAVDKFQYVLPYLQLVGGVFSIRREHFQKVNGYSNLYWGWGAEDDDMYLRMNTVGLELTRPAAYIGRYKMIRHTQRELAPVKWRQYLLKTVKKRFQKDGLNSVDYNVTFINKTALFTHIMVDIGQPPTVVPNISAMMH